MKVSNFIKNKSGSVATITAVMSVPLLFASGIAVDYAVMSNLQSSLQISADASVLASAKELALSSNDDATIREIAKQYVMSSLSTGINLEKYKDAVGIDTKVSEDRKSVSVDISLKWKPLVLKYIKPDAFPLRVQAMATLAGSENICIIALGATTNMSLTMKGVSSITANGCAIYSNNAGKKGISIVNGSTISSTNTYTAGGYKGPENNYHPRPIINSPEIVDPLIDRVAPKADGCTETRFKLNKGSAILYPGTYCGGITISGMAEVMLKSGEYILKDGSLKVSGKSIIKGKNVGFVFEGDTSTFDFGINTTINMTAPKSGALSGILFFENRNSPLLRKFTIRSRNAEQFEGTVYLPNGEFIVAKESRIGQVSKWTAIVANKISIKSGPRLQINSDYSNSNIPVPEGVGPQGTVTRLAK